MQYFLSRYNRLYAYFIHQNIRALYASTIMMLFVLVGLWFFLIHRSIQATITRTQNSIIHNTTIAQTIETLQKKCSQTKHAINDIQHKHQELKQAQSLYGVDPIMVITDIARATSLSLIQCELQSTKQKTHCTRCDIRCIFHGSYNQLIAFFNYCVQKRIPIKCYNLTMNQQRNNGYEAICTLRWYRLQ